MLNKGAFWILVCFAIAAAAWYRYQADAEPVAPAPSVVAFITGGSGTYWEVAAKGAKDAGQRLGIEVDVRMPKEAEDSAEQTQILTTLTGSGVDGVAVSPLDAEGQTPVINALADQAPVVTFDSDAPLSSRLGYVGTSNYSAGLMAGTLVKRAMPEGGKIAVLLANETKNNLAERKAGFQERIEESPNPEEEVDTRYEIVGYFVDNGSDEECAKVIREAVAANSDIACFVGLNARHGPVLMKVLKEDELLGKVKLVTFDTLDATLDGVADGSISSTIAQDPYKYGYEAITMLDSLCRGDARYMPLVGRGAIHVSVEPINNENVEEFRKRMKARSENKQASKKETEKA